MTCPFCRNTLKRDEVEMWESFTCPRCHGLVRVRRNYGARILRLVAITAAIFYLLFYVSSWVRVHRGISLSVNLIAVGTIDEYAMRLLPAKLEPASPGGLITF